MRNCSGIRPRYGRFRRQSFQTCIVFNSCILFNLSLSSSLSIFFDLHCSDLAMSVPPPAIPAFPSSINNLPLLINKSHPKLQQPNRSQHTQPRRQRLETPTNRPRNTASRENHTRQQSEFDTVALAVVDAVGAQQVEGSDGAACCDGGDGAGADVACDAAAGG